MKNRKAAGNNDIDIELEKPDFWKALIVQFIRIKISLRGSWKGSKTVELHKKGSKKWLPDVL